MVSNALQTTLVLGGLVTIAGLMVGLAIAVVLFRNGLPTPQYFGTERSLADITGFAGVGLTISSGVIMPFKRQLLARTRDRSGLRWIHMIVAGMGGFFIVLHITLSLTFFISLQYLLGGAATGLILFVWITGVPLTEDLRSFFPLHSFLSLVGVFLILVHAYSAGLGVPNLTPLVYLSMVAVVGLIGVGRAIAYLKSRQGR